MFGVRATYRSNAETFAQPGEISSERSRQEVKDRPDRTENKFLQKTVSTFRKNNARWWEDFSKMSEKYIFNSVEICSVGIQRNCLFFIYRKPSNLRAAFRCDNCKLLKKLMEKMFSLNSNDAAIFDELNASVWIFFYHYIIEANIAKQRCKKIDENHSAEDFSMCQNFGT